MPAARVAAVVGRPGAGKSSLAEALASELGRRGRRVATLAGDPGTAAPPMARAAAAAARTDAELVLLEASESLALPCIEVHRASAGPPLYDPAHADADCWIAILTDEPELAADCRVFRFQDTMWLQFLAMLVWDRAVIVR